MDVGRKTIRMYMSVAHAEWGQYLKDNHAVEVHNNNNNNNNANHTPVCAERQLMHVGYMDCLAVKAHPDNSVTAT